MTSAFPDWMHDVQTRIEAALSRLLPADTTPPVRLHQAMRYASLGGGKRVRPLLSFAAANFLPRQPRVWKSSPARSN